MVLFLLFLLLFLILIILLFQRFRARNYYTTNESEGDTLTYSESGGYYKLIAGGEDLEFKPLYCDRNHKIYGRLVILTHSSNVSEHYRVVVKDRSTDISTGIYRIDPNLNYSYINFKASSGDNRNLTIHIQKYNVTTQEAISGEPSGLKLVSASAYYY
jgi:hypothetical protein